MTEYAIAVFNGDGVEKNEEAAYRLFAKAAARGGVIAMNRLARLLSAGRGVEENKIDAAAWHLIARKRGSTDPMLDDLLNGLTKDERASAESRALVLLPQASAALDAPAPRAQ
jgi:TPR repeat protein